MKANKNQIVNHYGQSSSLPSSSSSYSFSPSSSLINGVLDYSYKEVDKGAVFKVSDFKNEGNYCSNISTNIPQFLNHGNIIKIPKKVAYAIKRHIPKEMLRAINPDIEVSVEMCLLFTTKFTSTYFQILEDRKSGGKKALKAKYLRFFFSTYSRLYKNIIKALEYPLTKGCILHCDYVSAKNKKCYNYRLGEAYLGKGIDSYELRTKEAIHLLNQHYLRLYENAMQNPICKNLIHFYTQITLPSIEEIHSVAKRLIKTGFKTKKGDRLIYLNKRKRTSYDESDNLSFVDDSIKLYKYLTDGGLMFPRPGSEKSGGRVVDSLTLMPGWIRSMIKIEGENLEEGDYRCLHPNIAIALYGGKQEYITHEKIALISGLDIATVKKQHLSFFNETVLDMQHYEVYEPYLKIEPQMMEIIIDEKCASEFKHKITSRRMFKKEVEVMTDVIRLLNLEGIYVGYGYDALFCNPKHAERLKQVMDSTILEHGIKTTAKLSSEKKDYLLNEGQKASKVAA